MRRTLHVTLLTNNPISLEFGADGLYFPENLVCHYIAVQKLTGFCGDLSNRWLVCCLSFTQFTPLFVCLYLFLPLQALQHA